MTTSPGSLERPVSVFTSARLGELLRRRGLPGDREQARAVLERAYQDALSMHIPDAEVLRRLLLLPDPGTPADGDEAGLA